MTDERYTPTRRQLIAATTSAAAVGLAGCSSPMQPDQGSMDYVETDFDDIPQDKEAIEQYEGEDIVIDGYVRYIGNKKWSEDDTRHFSTWELYPDDEPDMETEPVFVVEYYDELTDLVPEETQNRTAVDNDVYEEELRIAGELDAWAEDTGGLFEGRDGWQSVIMAERAFHVEE